MKAEKGSTRAARFLQRELVSSDITLRPSPTRMHCGRLKYVITYDHAAGRKHRYTVMVLTATEPVVIGRELDLKTTRDLIKDYENLAPLWWGDRRAILKLMRKVSDFRKASHG